MKRHNFIHVCSFEVIIGKPKAVYKCQDCGIEVVTNENNAQEYKDKILFHPNNCDAIIAQRAVERLEGKHKHLSWKKSEFFYEL